MSEALDRILPYVHAFSEGIERCRNAKTYNAPDWQDAYNRLNRLRERYINEKQSHMLNPDEESALDKVFEGDVFIKGMLDGRQIGEHVHKKSGEKPIVRLKTNRPIPISVEVSAGSFFEGPTVAVCDAQGQIHYINHLEQLKEAKRRIQSALTRAMKKQS